MLDVAGLPGDEPEAWNAASSEETQRSPLSSARPTGGAAFQPLLALSPLTDSFRARCPMLDSVVTFDVATRVRELELSIARRVRDVLRSHIRDNAALEGATRELLSISRDYASSFHAINDRARIRQEVDAE